MPDAPVTGRGAPASPIPPSPTKYVLKWPMHGPVELFNMPDDAVVIDVNEQNGVPTLWTLSSTDSVDVPRTFVGFGTGHSITGPNLHYVGSAHHVEGSLVFHVFERVANIRDAGAHGAHRGEARP